MLKVNESEILEAETRAVVANKALARAPRTASFPAVIPYQSPPFSAYLSIVTKDEYHGYQCE